MEWLVISRHHEKGTIYLNLYRDCYLSFIRKDLEGPFIKMVLLAEKPSCELVPVVKGFEKEVISKINKLIEDGFKYRRLKRKIKDFLEE